jgi:tetratricopeptide (TPR) repeat protein
MIRAIYLKNKENLNVLEIFAECLYNLGEFNESIKICEKTISIQADYKSEIYVVCCLSLAKIKNYNKSLQIIEEGSLVFPENAEIYYYKGKILYHLKKYS